MCSVSCLVFEPIGEMLNLDHMYTSKAVLRDSPISILFITVSVIENKYS